MLDPKLLRRDPDAVKAGLARKKADFAVVDRLVELDARRRELIARGDELKAHRNEVSQELGKRKKAGEDISEQAARMREVGAEIAGLDAERAAAEEEQQRILELLPNLPAAEVPDGKDADDNVEVRAWGGQPAFDFAPKPHWDLGEELGVLDFKRSAKISGSRFWILKGQGARLERALVSFMLDLHTGEHGYTEIMPPSLVNRDTMFATGQLPKFEEDLFKTGELYLIPTSEVPITNLHRDEILDAADLPLYYAGFTPCFRSEAGAAGRDTRGLVRVHQFHKVELVKFALPENSFEELEKMVANAEKVLQLLALPYRVVRLCSGDMGFSAAMTYDLEFWSAAQQKYVEISSCSNCTDFQARRGQMRFRRAPGAAPELVHTLNGSGLAVGRTMVAILENYQQADGSVVIPEVLRPYMGGQDRIARQ